MAEHCQALPVYLDECRQPRLGSWLTFANEQHETREKQTQVARGVWPATNWIKVSPIETAYPNNIWDFAMALDERLTRWSGSVAMTRLLMAW